MKREGLHQLDPPHLYSFVLYLWKLAGFPKWEHLGGPDELVFGLVQLGEE